MKSKSSISEIDGEQPAKFLKVYNGLITTDNKTSKQHMLTISKSALDSNNGVAQLQLPQIVGGGVGSLIVSPSCSLSALSTSSVSLTAPTAFMPIRNTAVATQSLNGYKNNTSEIGRLPGGAELNILSKMSPMSSSSIGAPTYYQANGKLTTLISGGSNTGGGNNSILSKDNTIVTTAAGFTPLIVAANTNNADGNVHYTYAGDFAQLIAATQTGGCSSAHILTTTTNCAPVVEPLNGKRSPASGGQQALQQLNTHKYLGGMKSMVVKVAATKRHAAGATSNELAERNTHNSNTTKKSTPTL